MAGQQPRRLTLEELSNAHIRDLREMAEYHYLQIDTLDLY